MLLAQAVSAAPAISGVSGTLNHKSTITISGSGFGSKAKAAPLVWDDASGNAITDKWDGAWPNNNASYNTMYRSPMRSISVPHSHVTRYIAGAHAQNVGANGGYNVVFWKNVTISSFPTYIYASWYQRGDDAWTFGGDNNLKTFAYSNCCTPYEMPNNWYTAYGAGPTSPTAVTQYVINDDGGSLMNPDLNSHNAWWGTGTNPFGGKWTKVEVTIKVTNQNDGYVKVLENGQTMINYSGPTDKYPGNSRSIGIGGYAREYGYTNNWRYFADAYVDNSLQRVVLANNADLSKATVIEAQVPTAWADGSVSVSTNLGQFSNGQTAYMFVFDASGNRNATGYAVTAGGAGTTQTAPNPPTQVTVQ